MITDSELADLWAKIVATRAIATVKNQGSVLEIKTKTSAIQIPKIAQTLSVPSIRRR